jgi:hypothetical protein
MFNYILDFYHIKKYNSGEYFLGSRNKWQERRNNQKELENLREYYY